MILVPRRDIGGIDMNEFRFYQCILLALLLLLCPIIGCKDNYASVSFVKVESEGTKLINGIKSYQSIDKFKDFLYRSPLQWEESKDKPSPKGRPPYNVHVITVKRFSHLGYAGELKVTFFNNRLISTTFYPIDAALYIEALEKLEKVTFNSNKEANLPSFTQVRVAVDYQKRTNIDWSDSRLDKEMELWIKKYS